MAVDDRIRKLKDIKFFEDASDADVAALAKMCREVSFPARATIFEECERATDVYFILDGSISLAICDAAGCRQISVLGKGDLLGWSPLIGRTRLFDTARTAIAVKAIAFDAEELLQFCKDNAAFGFEFMRRAAVVLGERLNATRRQLVKASGVHLPEYAMDSD
jgi:CRP-like cAMP-binding protein